MKKIFILTVAVAFIGFVSCTSDDFNENKDTPDVNVLVPMSFTGSTDEGCRTQFDGNDKILTVNDKFAEEKTGDTVLLYL